MLNPELTKKTVEAKEAKEAKNVKELNNRTKYDVTHNDIIRLLNGSKGDNNYVISLEGQAGGNSCWTAEYSLDVIRGECKILSKSEVVKETEDIKSILIPESRYCVVVEYSSYTDINGREEEKETYHFFTVNSGWKRVTVYL